MQLVKQVRQLKRREMALRAKLESKIRKMAVIAGKVKSAQAERSVLSKASQLQRKMRERVNLKVDQRIERRKSLGVRCRMRSDRGRKRADSLEDRIASLNVSLLAALLKSFESFLRFSDGFLMIDVGTSCIDGRETKASDGCGAC